MDFDKICRICLKETEQLIPIFVKNQTHESNISFMWNFCFGDEVNIEDGYPENICENCANVVVQFYNVKSQYQTSVNHLQTILNMKYNENEILLKLDEGLVNVLNTGDVVCLVDHDYTSHYKETKLESGDNHEIPVNATKTKKHRMVDSKLVRFKLYLSNMEKESPFKCNWCQQNFSIYRKFYKHVNNHFKRECVICYNPEITKPEVCIHKTHACVHCGFTSSVRNYFIGHLKSHSKRICKHNTNDCNQCLKMLLDWFESPKEQINCSFCDSLVPHINFAAHFVESHLICIHLNNKDQCRVCLGCPEINVKNGRKKTEFKCYICGQSYASNFYLHHHLLKHDNKKNYTCQFCGVSFLLKEYLKNHLEIHVPGQYTCEICGKLFTRRILLKKHHLTHSDKRNYVCNICKRSFKQSAHLKTHMVVHTNEKLFSCEVCGKRFGLKGSLTKHLFNIHKLHINVS